MAERVIINMEELYLGGVTARLSELKEFERKALDLAGEGKEVVLTGQGPIWLYLKVAHALHGKVASLIYDSPVTGEVVVFNHSPF